MVLISAKEIYDYISAATADSTSLLNLTARGIVRESGSINQIVHLGDDGSEEVVELSTAKEFYIDVPWGAMTEDEAGTVIDFWGSATIGNGKMRTFKYKHAYGATTHTYVARFDSDLARDIRDGNIHNMSVRLKVTGYVT